MGSPFGGGADYEILLWIFSLLTSVTTDHGIEIGLCDVPDILGAFLRKLMGVPMSQLVVDMGSRLFWRAVRIPGWSHMWSNLMHEACKSVGPKWPLILNICRVMCSFYSNQTWRKEFVDSIIGSKKVKSDSMYPLIRTGSRVFYEKIGPHLNQLKTDNIVVFTPPIEFYQYQYGMENVRLLVKRIVAMKVSHILFYYFVYYSVSKL